MKKEDVMKESSYDNKNQSDTFKSNKKPIQKKEPQPNINSRNKDLMFWILIIALIALPLAATMLHIKLHSEDYPWLVYITAFDAVIITLMYLSKKTMFSAFILNTTLFVVGVIAHLTVAGGWGDVLMAIPDFAIGYVLWREYH